MKDIYQRAMARSMSYQEFRNLCEQLVLESKTTGNEQTDMLIEFTKLNHQRMKRLDKTQKIMDALVDAVKNVSIRQKWLLLTESWCGDAAQSVPVLEKIASESDNIDLRIVLRDENDELMQKYLTNGGKSIPKLVAITESMDKELFTWGPRPAEATQLVVKLKEEYGGITSEVKEALQKWYNEDKGVSLQRELIELIKNATH